MVKILSAGEALVCGQVRWEETGRFCLFMQPDGNLVIYAHLLEPQPRLIATGHTGTYGWGEGVDLMLNSNGRLYLKKGSTAHQLMLLEYRGTVYDTSRRPPRTEPDPLPPPPAPRPPIAKWGKSSLHLQSDGNLCLYYSDPPVAGGVFFSMGMLLQDLAASKPVNPNAGIFSSGQLQVNIPREAATNTIENNSGRPLECFGKDGQRVLIQNGESTSVSYPQGSVGQLSLPLWGGLPQFENGSVKPGTGDANPGSNNPTDFLLPEVGKPLVVVRNRGDDGLMLG
jgi:hypothetical protein